MTDDLGERFRAAINRMRDKPEEPLHLTEEMRTDELEHVTEVLRGEADRAPKRYTAEQAAVAVLWKLETMIRAIASDRGLDKSEVHRQVFRKLTLASFRLRDHPNALVEDVRDVASEYKMGQLYHGSGCD